MSDPDLELFPPLRLFPPSPLPPRPSSFNPPPPPPPFGPASLEAAVDASPFGAASADVASVEAALRAAVGAPLGAAVAMADGATVVASLGAAVGAPLRAVGAMGAPPSSLAPRVTDAAAMSSGLLAAVGSGSAGSDATVEAEHAAGSASLKGDLTHFLKNREDISIIRAQLNTLKGKELAEFQRGSVGGGRNYKQNHPSKGKIGARQVFGKIPQPTQGHPRLGTGFGKASLPHVSPPAPLRKAWVTAVSSNLDTKKFKLLYRPPNVEDGKIIVEASHEALASARNRWSEYLVGYFIEGRLPFPSVEGIAKNLWANLGLEETLCFHRDFFFFKFPNASSRTRLLDHGPFLFGGRPLILQQWSPSLKLNKESHKSIPLWAKIHHIPLAMWNPTGLGDIASAIGIPLYADNATEKLNRFDYARICVEVDASKPLLDEFSLRIDGDIVTLTVEYQWRPKRCPKCCSFGHICENIVTSAPQAMDTSPTPEIAPSTTVTASLVAAAPAVQQLAVSAVAPAAPAGRQQPTPSAVAAPFVAVLASAPSSGAGHNQYVAGPSAPTIQQQLSPPPVSVLSPSAAGLKTVQAAPSVSPQPSKAYATPLANAAATLLPAAAAVQQAVCLDATLSPRAPHSSFAEYENSFFEIDDGALDGDMEETVDLCDFADLTTQNDAISPKTRGQKAKKKNTVIDSTSVVGRILRKKGRRKHSASPQTLPAKETSVENSTKAIG